ncbi:very-long-chain 3-oxoacyl-CoA reductase isoform X1 [Anopheles stephensi]|uniref:very-long-chain 3-oxoacyl-CoA reductase isoform X1 n=1 Tax=Anopheles stephensi TaxID=30069 RepID=UPI00165872D9|nr:very-long-chain 3-oxoacyl-CoA reductase isoform X1 [Anopheles stephensi]
MVTVSSVLGSTSAVLVSLFILRKVFPWIYQNLIGPKVFGCRINLKKTGEWALITGATDGIGKAYAQALARKGLNIILISRTLSKLQDVAKEIETEFKVRTMVIAADFTSGGEIYDQIQRQIENMEIGVLVNNVGMSYANPEYLLELQDNEKLIKNLLSCNILSVTRMCQLVMPGMVKRHTGVVINISSLSAVIPAPLLTVYSASKAYMDKFSEDLASEYAKHNIVVQSVLPGPVATNMSKIRKSTWMACSPKVFVGSAINTLGHTRQTTGYFPHALLELAINTLSFVSPRLMEKLTINTMQNIRARAMKKSTTRPSAAPSGEATTLTTSSS